jgi:DNA-binding response OmpR family regulator
MSHPKILVVNDEPALRSFLGFNLRARGFEVADTLGTPEVFNMIEKDHTDLVILDLMIRGTDGFELCQKICSSGKTHIIAFNMRGSEADLLRCLDMGVDDYLGKPFGADELMARVRAVLHHERRMQYPEPAAI